MEASSLKKKTKKRKCRRRSEIEGEHPSAPVDTVEEELLYNNQKDENYCKLSGSGGGDGEETGGGEGEEAPESKKLKEDRQTALFKASQTKEVYEELQQGYCVVPSSKRFLVLHAFLKKNLSKKVMVFFSSCNSVKFHADLLKYIQIDCYDIHGKQKQQKRTSTFFDFCKAKKGILLCTDVVVRGLDIPSVDWILQYDPPDEPKEYVHRVGRTARGEGAEGNALLFLLPEELKFVSYLIAANVPVKQYEFSEKKVPNLQSQLEKLVGENYYLLQSAKEAYRSYILAYNSHSMKQIFDVHHLNLQDVAVSFCFRSPPKINLNLESSASKFRKIIRGNLQGFNKMLV